MTTLVIRHKVKDYGSWKRVYDAYDRKGDGCTRASVHRDAADPSVVVVTERFGDAKAAKAHASSGKLKAAMGEAGVQGAPEMWFLEDVEDVGY